MATRLVPFHVFKAEITRLNELYWSTKYSYNRVVDFLRSIDQLTIVPESTLYSRQMMREK